MSNNQNGRALRSTETREKEVRPVSWKPAHDLPAPDPQDGYVFHWKRVAMMGVADPANMAKAKREGWVPCQAEDHPEMLSDFAAFGLKPQGIIEIGGLVLCKSTVENAQARETYYSNMSTASVESVDNNFLRENDPRMPLFSEKSSKVSFGRGS
jgi:hypothetical protein